MNENIAKALVKAQKEFGPALKTSTNPHFKSKYADLAACVEAVMDALNNNGIMLMQLTHPSDSGVNVETLFIHESGETASSGQLHVPAPKHDPQGYGSALSYARRYSLMAACGIAPEDDDGNAASQPATAPKQQKAFDLLDAKARLGKCTTMLELKVEFERVWVSCPPAHRKAIEVYKDEIKSLIESAPEEETAE
jgi:LmbE family N-acetylglucosaminyl deacetylase